MPLGTPNGQQLQPVSNWRKIILINLKIFSRNFGNNLQKLYFYNMLRLFKIVLLFISGLITYINSGLEEVYLTNDIYSSHDKSSSEPQFISAVNYFQLTNIEFGIKNKLSPDRLIKYSQEIKSSLCLLKNNLTFKAQVRNITPLFKDPIFKVKVFKSPDICFPFNYFW